jgi:hypothetical protein
LLPNALIAVFVVLLPARDIVCGIAVVCFGLVDGRAAPALRAVLVPRPRTGLCVRLRGITMPSILN